MARSIDEIYNQIIALKNQTEELSELTSNSQTAVWKLPYQNAAVAINLLEQQYDLFKKDIEDLKAKAVSQTSLWWNDKMLNYFQYDDQDTEKGVLTIGNDLIYSYPVLDSSKRIIRYCATKRTEGNHQVVIKVAKDSGQGTPVQLSEDELLAAKEFVNKIQMVGALISVVSFPADKLSLNIDITFDGQYTKSTVQDNVKNAINMYLLNLKFDGTIEIIRLIDAIQAVEGVKSAYLNSATGKADAGTKVEFTRNYNASAGYAELDEQNSVFNLEIE